MGVASALQPEIWRPNMPGVRESITYSSLLATTKNNNDTGDLNTSFTVAVEDGMLNLHTMHVQCNTW